MDDNDVEPFVLTPEQIVESLYRGLLGCQADESGLAHWAELVRSTGDLTPVLKGLLNSQEYAARSGTNASGDRGGEATANADQGT